MDKIRREAVRQRTPLAEGVDHLPGFGLEQIQVFAGCRVFEVREQGLRLGRYNIVECGVQAAEFCAHRC